MRRTHPIGQAMNTGADRPALRNPRTAAVHALMRENRFAEPCRRWKKGEPVRRATTPAGQGSRGLKQRVCTVQDDVTVSLKE